MEILGKWVIYLMMAFVFIGAIASIRSESTGLGKEFKEGLHSIGPIFIPVAGIMAAVPYISTFIESITGRIFGAIGADPALAAGSLLAGDMGGYQLALAVSQSHSGWIMGTITAFMAGSTIVFTIPVGLAMLPKSAHRHMALGIMSGLLAIPFGVLITTSIIWLTRTPVRAEVNTSGDSTTALELTWSQVFMNLLPVIIFVLALALLLRFATNFMIRAFLVFGKVLDSVLKIILAIAIIEYFTGFFSSVWVGWGFDPIIADKDDQFRALEIAGYIGIMLAGAFPLVYAIKTFLNRPLTAIGKRVGFSSEGAAGVLAAAANVLALFRLIPTMPAKDRVLCIAFAVCAAFTFGDHLAFMANFQPNMVVPMVIGKLIAGLIGIIFATVLALPTVRREQVGEVHVNALAG